MTNQSEKKLPLIGARCPHCDHIDFPPVSICSNCSSSDEREPVELGPVGTLYTFTIVHVAVSKENAPYAVGYVDFPEGVRVFGRINPPEQLSVQTKVRAHRRTDGSCLFEPMPD